MKYLWIFELGGEPEWCDGTILVLCSTNDSDAGRAECRKYILPYDDYKPIRFAGEPIPRYKDDSAEQSDWWEPTHIWPIETDHELGIVVYAYHDG